MKTTKTGTLSAARPISLVLVAVCALFATLATRAATPPPPKQVQAAAPMAPTLDTQHLFALGMIETGNDDGAIGSAGEISRYQLRPTVWKTYCSSRDYRNPQVSVQVARQHWNYLAAYFQEKTGRVPTDYDMYVLWNTGGGYYARKGFSKHQIASVVQDRAQRFVNLVNRHT